MKKLLSTVLRVIISLAGAGALGAITLERSEPLNGIWFVVAASCTYLVAYRFYSAFLAARVVLETLGGYFRSHPYPEEGIAELRRLAAQNGWETRFAEKPLGVWAILHPDQPGHEPSR